PCGLFYLYFLPILTCYHNHRCCKGRNAIWARGPASAYSADCFFSPTSPRHNTSEMRILRDNPAVQRKMRWLRGTPSEAQSQLASLQAQRCASKTSRDGREFQSSSRWSVSKDEERTGLESTARECSSAFVSPGFDQQSGACDRGRA